MLTFYHHFASLPCVKVRLFLEELALPYRPVFMDVGKGAQRTPEYLNKNPLGQVPFIEDDAISLGESNAILRYLAEKQRRFDFYPAHLETRAQIDQWIDFLGLNVCDPISTLIWFRAQAHKYNYPIDHKAIAEAEARLQKTLPICEQHLQGRNYFIGPTPTLADLVLLPDAGCASRGNIDFHHFPNLSGWLARMSARPSWARVYKTLDGQGEK